MVSAPRKTLYESANAPPDIAHDPIAITQRGSAIWL